MSRFCILLLFLICACLEGSDLDINVAAESAILINAETGAVLYEKNPHKPLYPASITKIATAWYAIKVRGNKLDKQIAAEHDSVASISEQELKRSNYTLPSYWLIPGASHIGIKRGEVLSLEDLLYGTMLASGGDASNVIAQYIGGTIPMFMKLVNEYLQEIGCKNTVFKNPHGLHHPKHVTTAFDMALLTREAMRDETFCRIVKSVRYTRPQTNKQSPTTLIQTNRLVKRGKYYYPKAIGVKTGYTSKAQNTLVAAARDGDRTLIAVLMKCKDRDTLLKDAVKMFEAAFQEKKVRRRLLRAGQQKPVMHLPHASSSLKTEIGQSVIVEYFPAEAPQIKCLLQWDEVALPVSKGDRVGCLSFKDQYGQVLAEAPLLARSAVDYSFFYRMRYFFTGRFWFKVLAVLLGAVFIGALVRELRK